MHGSNRYIYIVHQFGMFLIGNVLQSHFIAFKFVLQLNIYIVRVLMYK